MTSKYDNNRSGRSWLNGPHYNSNCSMQWKHCNENLNYTLIAIKCSFQSILLSELIIVVHCIKTELKACTRPASNSNDIFFSILIIKFHQSWCRTKERESFNGSFQMPLILSTLSSFPCLFYFELQFFNRLGMLIKNFPQFKLSRWKKSLNHPFKSIQPLIFTWRTYFCNLARNLFFGFYKTKIPY